MARHCTKCGKDLTLDDSFFWKNQPVCHNCHDEFEEAVQPILGATPLVRSACPSCGKLRNPVDSITIDRRTGDRVKSSVLIVGIVFALVGLVLAGIGVMEWIASRTPPLIGLVIGFLALSGGLPVILNYIRADKAEMFKFRCTPCGKRWEKTEDEISQSRGATPRSS